MQPKRVEIMFPIAKLFVSVIALTDTGSVATTAFVTDMSMTQCQMLSKQEFNKKADVNIQGRIVSISVRSFCFPMEGQPMVRGNEMPPAIAGIIEGFLGNLR
jgi:hypothetical protein